jgi:hypothetical protein
MVLAGGRGSRGSQLYRRTASTGKLSGLFPAGGASYSRRKRLSPPCGLLAACIKERTADGQ